MLSPSELADLAEIQQLAFRYAAAVDNADVDAFLAVFHPEGGMRVFAPGAEEPFSTTVGHDELATVPVAMGQRFIRTAHSMTDHLVELDGPTATGSVLCTARHLPVADGGGTDLVIVLRYFDRYERRDGRWRFLDRELRFQWMESHPTLNHEQFVMP